VRVTSGVAPRLRVDQPTQTMEKLGGFFLAPIFEINQCAGTISPKMSNFLHEIIYAC
jgi:hypothetical protein